PARHAHHRGDGHGGRRHHHPGPVHLRVQGRSPGRQAERCVQELGPAPAFHAAGRLLRPRQGSDGGHGMSDASQGLGIDQVTILIAVGMAMTILALGVVFGGFLTERRLNDRLEDLEGGPRSGPRTIEMATLRRVEKAGRLPTLDKLLWRWFPNASSLRQKLQTTGMNVTLGDFAFATLALSMAMAFLLYLVLDLPPGVALVGSLSIGVGLPNIVIGMKTKKRSRQFNLLFPDAIDLIVRALRAGLPVQEAIGTVSRDI